MGGHNLRKCSYLYLAWTNKDCVDENSLVYFTAIPNIYTNYGVCLGQNNHYAIPNASFDDLINLFWNGKFRYTYWDGYEVLCRIFDGGYGSWAKCSLEEVFEKINLTQPRYKYSFKDFVNGVKYGQLLSM